MTMKKILLSALILGSMNAIAQEYETIESVEYDPINERFLVSNGNSIISRDNDSTLSYFGTDAKANYGMEVMNGILFCIHNTNVKGYDLVTEEEVMTLNIPGLFLNGMASDGTDRLWITDYAANKLYEVDVADLENPSYEEVITDIPQSPKWSSVRKCR